MPHKITITGVPIRSITQHKKYFTFIMQEAGSPSAPKGLPLSKKLTYRIYVNQKQLNKAKLTDVDLTTKKLLVQGEPVIGPIQPEYQNELGVVCFQLQELEIKEKTKETTEKQPEEQKLKPPKENISPQQSTKVKSEIKEVKGPNIETIKATNVKLSLPEDTDRILLLEDIKIPEEFLAAPPKQGKIEQIEQYMENNGRLDQPIKVTKDTFVLVDGYARYILLKQKKIFKVPVQFV